MEELSPSQIAKQWRVSKTTIYNHLNSGTMAYKTTEEGHKRIELSEVIRVLGEPKEIEEPRQSDSTREIELLRDQIEELKKELAASRDEKKQDKEFFQNMIQSQNEQIADALSGIKQLMIEHKPEQQPSPVSNEPQPPTPPEPEKAEEPPKEKPKKRGLFTRLIAAAIDD